MSPVGMSHHALPHATLAARVSVIAEPWRSLALGGFLYVSLLLWWRSPWVLFAWLALGTGVLLASRPSRRILILWGLSTLVGLSGEHWMTSHRVWIYAQPDLGGMPVWLVWIWGYLMVTFVRLSDWLTGNLSAALKERQDLRQGLKLVAQGAAIAYLVVVVTVVAPVFAIWYLLIGAVTLACCRRGSDLVLFWVAALLGLLGEASAIAAGVWTYSAPFFAWWGIPISMPMAWGLSALILHHVSGLWMRAASPAATVRVAPAADLMREARWLSGLALYMYAAALACWRLGWLPTLLLTFGWLALLLRRPSARNVLLSGLGLTIGVGVEYLAVSRWHLWTYAQPDLGVVPSWILPAHGSMPVLLVCGAECLHAWAQRWQGARSAPVRRSVWWAGYLACLAYWIAVILHVAAPIATINLVLGIVVLCYPCSGRDLIAFWLTAIVAPLMDYGGIRAGIWSYTTPFFTGAGIPLSLSLSWGFSTVIGCRLSETALRWWHALRRAPRKAGPVARAAEVA